jgi:hypothetical protein
MNIIPERPKVTSSQLKNNAMSILYDMNETFDLIEAIQVKACHSSLLLKRLMRNGKQKKTFDLKSFRNDPLLIILFTEKSQLLDDLFWNGFVSMEIFADLRLKIKELLLLATKPVDAIVETFSNLVDAPEILTIELFTDLLAYTYRTRIAAFTFLALSLVPTH